MKATEAQLRAQAKYDAKATRQIKFKFNITTDADILEKLDSVDNKQGYIKDLIRKDLASNKRIIGGSFTEGDFITVSINGKEYKRKVKFSKKWNDLIITIDGKEYSYSDFY